MKKLLITSGIWSPDIGGPASYGRVIAQAFAPGTAVTVLTYSNHRSEQSDRPSRYRILRVWRKVPKPLRQLSYLLHVLWLARKVDAIYSLGTIA